MDSQDMTITYKAIQNRAEQDAQEYMPDWPKTNTIESWESFVADLEDLDAQDIAHESGEWDWVIYYHRALELCQAVPNDVLHEAESQFEDMGGAEGMGGTFGLYELAVRLAAIIVTQEISDAVDQVREELLEVAENQIENMESES